MNSDIHGESKIIKYVEELRSKGKPVPRTIAEIPNFPYKDFSALRADLLSGQITVQRFATEYSVNVLNVLATSFEQFTNSFYILITFLGPILSICLAIFVSGWWLVGLLLFPIGMSRTKHSYNQIILRSAVRSESVFCFLYYVRQICITSADYEKSYYWKHQTE